MFKYYYINHVRHSPVAAKPGSSQARPLRVLGVVHSIFLVVVLVCNMLHACGQCLKPQTRMAAVCTRMRVLCVRAERTCVWPPACQLRACACGGHPISALPSPAPPPPIALYPKSCMRVYMCVCECVLSVCLLSCVSWGCGWAWGGRTPRVLQLTPPAQR